MNLEMIGQKKLKTIRLKRPETFGCRMEDWLGKTGLKQEIVELKGTEDSEFGDEGNDWVEDIEDVKFKRAGDKCVNKLGDDWVDGAKDGRVEEVEEVWRRKFVTQGDGKMLHGCTMSVGT